MKKERHQPADAALRRRAEERLKAREHTPQSDADTARLLHELEVHQIELEMQNEELKAARTEVEAGLALYSDLYDFAPTSYLTLDREGVIRLVNLTGARLLGVVRSRLVKWRFCLFVTEGDRRIFNDFLQKVFASRAKETCEVALAPEGSPPRVVRIEGIVSEDGQECRAAAVDITELRQAEGQSMTNEVETRKLLALSEQSRLTLLSLMEDQKQAEAAVRDSEELYFSLVENLPQSILRKDREGRFLFCNLQLCKHLKHSLQEIIGKTDADLFPPQLAEAYRQDDLQVMESGKTLDRVEEFVDAEGRKSFVQVVKTPLRDVAGGVIGIQAIFWDITERMKAAETLLQHTEELRARNEELERFNNASMGRELRMIELKQEINQLCEQAGLPPRHSLDFLKENVKDSSNTTPTKPGQP